MQNHIRNFCIIAHIDHGKSTLADRMLELTGTIRKSDKAQVLDKMDLEQERWITIKLAPARMRYNDYELNLIDTPWHVDFQYEVSRSLAAVEWAILLVDATQGIQAQTLSTLYMGIDYWLEIIPVLNKIDLPAANPTRVAQELEHLLWVDRDEILQVSAKTWENVTDVLDAIIDKIPDPKLFRQVKEDEYRKNPELQNEQVSRALIFDSVYDKYRWVVAYVKVLDWNFKAWAKVKLIHSHKDIELVEVGYFNPDYNKDKDLHKGQIWYIVTGQKSVRDAKIWDTIFYTAKIDKNTDIQWYAIPGFKRVKPFVYAWVYPMDADDFDKLREAFEKLSLNDSAIDYEYESSKALGHGFRVGFLGTLHMDIIKERLFREYNIDTIFTIPNVIYLVKLKSLNIDKVKSGMNIMELIKSEYYKKVIKDYKHWLTDEQIYEQYSEELKYRLMVRSGADMPDPGFIEEVREPYAEVEIVWPSEYSGNIMDLVQEYRWEMKGMEYIDDTRVLRKYSMPMWEIIIDFYDRLKSSTKGYATMNYEVGNYKKSDLVRLDILVNSERVEAFSMIAHKDKSYYIGRDIVEKLKQLIPKHLFPIPLQASLGSRIIARETIPALKKDVLAKCYGWDVTRKRKLLAKQKEGKKKMKQMWRVSVPNDIFIKMVSR